MPFTNNYRKFIQAVAVLVFAFVSLTCSTRQQQPLTMADNPVERAERVKDICESLPKPEGFQLIEKTLPPQPDDYRSVIYRFRSSRSKDEIYPTFVVWSNTNGWMIQKNESEALVFQKFNQADSVQTITVSFKQTTEGAVYVINCSEASIKAAPVSTGGG